MTFEENFPSLKGTYEGGHYHICIQTEFYDLFPSLKDCMEYREKENDWVVNVFKIIKNCKDKQKIEEHCLDKQKVRDVIKRVCTYEWENAGGRLLEELGI